MSSHSRDPGAAGVALPFSRSDLLGRFAELGLTVTTYNHEPVFTVEESRGLHAQIPGMHSKNLFFKDAGGRLWLVTAAADRRIDLKTLHTRIGAKRLSFGKPELLREVLGVEPGSVTPFALINDQSRSVTFVLDQAMVGADLLNFHPLENSATTAIAPKDFLLFLQSTGHVPIVVALAAE